ncbi:DNA kinase/phosphatase Pnk1 [Savitreella phatthalungensis]
MSGQGLGEPAPKKQKTDAGIAKAAKIDPNFFVKSSGKPKPVLKLNLIERNLLRGEYRTDKLLEKTGSQKDVKVAAFDLDGTLITTKSGAVFSRDAADWEFWDRSVPRKLEELYAEGYVLVIFSNQAGAAREKQPGRHDTLRQKLVAICANLDLPLLLYAATGHDNFRKPRTGMWQALTDWLQQHQIGSKIDLAGSFYVGDAAGRLAGPISGSSRKDFSASDRKFALNLGLLFHTPQEFFQNKSLGGNAFDLGDFDPLSYQSPADASYTFERKTKLELLVLVGSPAAGKSTFVKQALEPLGYERVNQDILGNIDKCIKRATAILSQGTSVVVDNTNASKSTRQRWIAVGQKYGAKCRVIHLTASPALCKHNNAVRALSQQTYAAGSSENRDLLPEIAFRGYASRFEQPALEEGFEEVIELPFVVDESNEAWRQYYL